MKKITLITALMIGFTTVKANHLNSELSLKMYDNSAFTVTFDNYVYNVAPTASLGLTNLTPGNHYMRVSKMVYRRHGPPMGMQQLVFSGMVNIPTNARVFAMIDPYRRYHVMEVLPNYVPPVCDGYKHYEGCGHAKSHCGDYKGHGKGYGKGHGRGDGYYEEDERCGQCKGDHYCEKHKGGYHKPVGMNPNDFAQLKSSIAGRSFDSSKLQMAKQAVSMNYLSAAQVAELVGMMTFESSKLELAKFAYTYTVDRGNYYKVNDEFTFESSIRELGDYISRIG